MTCAEQIASQGPDFVVESNWQAGAAQSVMDIFDAQAIPVISIDVVHPNAIFMGADNWTSGFLAGGGIHNYDIVHWALNLDHTGPVAIEGQATYPPAGDLCDCPVTWKIVYTYAKGLTMDFVDGANLPQGNGIKFEGQDGWIQMHYGGQVTASDPKILSSKIGDNEVHLYDAGPGDDNFNFVRCVKSRKVTCSPIEAAHRSSSVGFLGAIVFSMVAGRFHATP